MTILQTSRLRLRPFRAEDSDAYAAMCADPEVMRYVGDRGVLSREDAWRQMAMLAGHWHLRGFGMWAIEERESGAFVGRVGLHYPEGWPGREVGWALARAYWGRGYALEAARAVARRMAWRLPSLALVSLGSSRTPPTWRWASPSGFPCSCTCASGAGRRPGQRRPSRKGFPMTLKTLLGIAAAYMALVGFGLIFAPQRFGTGAVPDDASTALIAYLRLFGSPFLGIAVLDWMARDAEPSRTRDAIVLGNIVGFAAIAALDLWGAFGGGRQLTKAFAVLHLLFAVAFIRVGRRSMSSKSR